MLVLFFTFILDEFIGFLINITYDSICPFFTEDLRKEIESKLNDDFKKI